MAAYIELHGHTFLFHVVSVADGAADGVGTITANHVGGQLVGLGYLKGSYLNLANHQTVLNDTARIVIPAYEATDAVLTLDLAGIDTVDQLGVGATHVTEDTARTNVGTESTGNIHVRDTVLDAQTLTGITHDTAVVLA